MPKTIEKQCVVNALELRSSSKLTLLFFALLLSFVHTGSAHAQSAQKGWSVPSSPQADTTDAQAVTTDAQAVTTDAQAVTTDAQAVTTDAQADTAVAQADTESPIADSGLQQQATELLVKDTATDQPMSGEDSAVSERAEPSEATLSDRDDASAEVSIPTTPVIDLDPQLRDNLERQLQQIIEIQENEDAFSENLGEAYLGYGQALQRAGRLDEARKMLANALHISKINYGVNSIEQRPMLLAMFELNYAKGDLDAAQESEKRIRWLEKKNPESRDDFSFDMVVRLGNLYMDSYLSGPATSQAGQIHLNQAGKYFEYAINRYGATPMNNLFMPYGELALVHFLQSKIKVDVQRPNYEFQRNQSHLNKADLFKDKPRPRLNPSSRSEYFMREYLAKARAEERLEDVVHALIGLGDINLLYDRKNDAAHFYELAWTEAQDLAPDHELVKAFEKPHAIPAFNYSRKRTSSLRQDNTVVVPATLGLNELGKVKQFTDISVDVLPKEVSRRAKRKAKRLRFRPIIENGEMVMPSEFAYNIKVKLRRPLSSNEG